MKKTLTVLLALMLLLALLAGCASSGSSTPAAPTDSSPASEAIGDAQPAADALTIGVSMNSADEFRTQLYKAIEKEATDRGHSISQTNADFDPSKQISDVESLIQKDPDVIILFAVDGEAAVAAVESVKNADIYCVVVDFVVYTDSYDVFIADDQQLHGQLQAEYVMDWLDQDPEREANIGYLVGAYIESAMDRHTGFVENCNADLDPRVNLLSEQLGNWMSDDAMAITEDWIQRYPEMNVFVAMNDDMAIGCIQALKAAGYDMDEVVVLGIDGTENGLESVKAGELDATTVVDTEVNATAVIDICERVAAGETFDETVKPEVIRLATIDNVG